MHQLLFVRRKQTSGIHDLSASMAWVYVGSANCSSSAWGQLSKDRSSKMTKLTCRNWECGVVMPVRNAHRPSTIGTGNATRENELLAEFDGLIPVPMKYPGEKYQGKSPWYFTKFSGR